MATHIRCDICDKQLKFDDDFAGQSIRCPRCDGFVRVRGGRRKPDIALRICLAVGGVVLLFVAMGTLVALGLGITRKMAAKPDKGAVAPDGANGEAPERLELSPAVAIRPGVLFQEAVLRPGALPMKVWYYRPEQAKGKLPLVLVPPAGSTLFAGMELAEGDRAEHYPYVHAGFAVGSFEIDGHVPRDAPDAVILKGARDFRDAKAGLNNARAALDFLLAKTPDVDADRIFIAGHSSAATLALLVAAHEPRIKGCASYCGVCDVETLIAPDLRELERDIPGYRDFIRFSSPKTHVEKLKCPVFLFHAQDDENTPVSESRKFANLLKKTNADVTLDTSARGGHYQAMINAGIPRGIAWMQKR